MSISSEFRKVKKLPPLWDTLRKIEFALGIGAAQMCEFLKITRREYERLKLSGAEPSLSSIFLLCDHLHVSFGTLVEGRIDYPTLVAHFVGKRDYLPEKYTSQAFTKKRVVLNILNHIEWIFGAEVRTVALRDLQLSEAAFVDLDETVNLRLTVDLIEWVRKNYKSNSMIEDMGKEILITKPNQKMVSELQESRNVRELFEFFFSGAISTYLEKNVQWKLDRIRGNEVLVTGTASDEIFALGKRYVSSPPTFLYRKGILSAVPRFLNLPDADVTVKKDFREGKRCQFSVDIEPLVREFHKKGFQLVH